MRIRLVCCVILSIISTASTIALAQRESDRALARKAVETALKMEAAGAADLERDANLELALNYDKDYAPAHWARGEVFENGKWQTMEEASRKYAAHPYLRAYEKKRKESRDTEAEHWELAKWCEARSMWQQKYAHLCRVLEINPKNDAARVALGWRQTSLGWASPQQFSADLRFSAEESQSLRQYGEQVNKIAEKLNSSNANVVQVGHRELEGLTDPLAVISIEKYLSSRDEAFALLALQCIQKVSHPIATRSLTRHAIFHPSRSVREFAINALTKRDVQGWVPGLLALLQDEIDLKLMPTLGCNGELIGLRQVFSQETRDSNDIYVVDTAYLRNVMTEIASANFTSGVEDRRRFPAETTEWVMETHYSSLTYATRENYAERFNQERRIGQAATSTVIASAKATIAANQRSSQMNSRVYEAIDKLEKEKIGSRPSDYWSWWNGRKYWKSLPRKRNSYTYQQSAYLDTRPAYAAYEQFDGTALLNTYSCLTAPTIIWTQTGRRPISTLKVGDVVYSQDVATGKIIYAPVIRTTISSEPIEIIALSTNNETIECTKGHEFFVSGKGWTMACDLKVGDRLHGATGSQMIVAICEAGRATVHNLVVANQANYLVGDARVLSHDFSERAENYYLVPGLEPESK